MEDTTVTFGKENFVGKLDGNFLDKYDVLSQLGKGGYAKVYEVRNKLTGEIRACKHISKIHISDFSKLELEVNILIKIDHPNIIKLYEIFESKSSIYLIMEKCKGGEVFDHIYEHIQSKKMYSEKNAADIFQQLMGAIEYCHNNGICHRDLKLENLLYLNEGNEEDNPIKVIDFGLSQLFHKQKLTTPVGTAFYLSPEILTGNYTEKCDIWSAGIILYILLSGDPPFKGRDEMTIYKQIAQLNFSFPDEKWRDISGEAKDLLRHMLCYENVRYSAKQVLEHPWLKNAKKTPLKDFQFDPMFFAEYVNSCNLKKISLLFIASRLNDNEINDLKKVFEAFDDSRDGQISFSELKQGLLELNSTKLTEEDIYYLFKSIDVDKNGRIDYTEFIAATISKKRHLNQERLFEAFCMLDRDNNGKITKEELMQVLRTEKRQEQEIERYIQAADVDGDGMIDYQEFLKIMG